MRLSILIIRFEARSINPVFSYLVPIHKQRRSESDSGTQSVDYKIGCVEQPTSLVLVSQNLTHLTRSRYNRSSIEAGEAHDHNNC